jgi:hypothetical protein
MYYPLKKSILVAAALSACFVPVHVQAQIGALFVNSPYAGVYAARINPATAAQMKQKWVVSLGEFDAKIFNNYMSASMPYHPYRLLLKTYPDSLRTEYNNPVWRWSWVNTNNTAKTVNLHSFIRIAGPSAIFRIKQHAFGISSDVNVFADLQGLPKPLVDKFYEDLKTGNKMSAPGVDMLNTPQKLHLNIRQQAWASIGFSYAYLWTFKRRKTLSAGITYKLLHGMGGSHIQVDADNMQQQADDKIRISSPGFEIKSLLPRNNVFYPKGYGGIDLGVQYSNKKSETGKSNNSKKLHPDYLFRIGASILDIGNLVYTRTIITELKSESQSINFPSINEVMQWSPDKIKDELMQTLEQFKDIAPETFYGKKTKVGLPTRLVVNGDMQITKILFADFIIEQNLRKRSGKNMNTFSYVSVSPRIEKRNVTVGLPLTLDNNYRNLNLGFYARVFFLYFGSRNIISIIHPDGKRSADLFLGVQFGNIPGKLLKRKTPYLFLKKRKCAEF